MLMANADDRIAGRVTLASMALAGPVLKNRQNSVTKIKIQAAGNGVTSTSRNNGVPINMPTPDTKKYEPLQRAQLVAQPAAGECGRDAGQHGDRSEPRRDAFQAGRHVERQVLVRNL